MTSTDHPRSVHPTRRVDTADLEPVAITPTHPYPEASIDPDASKPWLRRLWPVVALHRRPFTVALTAGVLAMLVQVSVPAVLRSGIDAVIDDPDPDLVPYAVLLVGLGVARFVLAGGFRYLLARTAFAIETDLRSLVYGHLTALSFEYYDRTQSGEVISRANTDIRSLQILFSFGPLVLTSALTFFVALGFMLSVSVPLTIVAVAPMPGVYVLGQRMREKVFPLTWVSQARQAEVATIVDENINGVRVVRSFAGERRQIGLLADAAQRLRWSQVATIDNRARFNPAIEALPSLGMAMVLLIGGWLAIDGSVSVGTLIAFNSYVIMIQVPFRMLGFMVLQIERAGASAGRIFEILDTEPAVVDRPGAVDLVEAEGRVRFDDVTFSYGDGPPVLDGFDLDVAPGETVAVVGRTGSGKSTITRLLARFYDVDAGRVTIDGHDVRDLTVRSVRHHVGVVTDEPFLFSASIHDNIAFGRPDASRDEVVAAARAAQAHDFVGELADGYDTVVGERGYTLSGGQRQRIAIARTLLERPAVLVLDDATSAIDVVVEERIHDALGDLLGTCTTIVIAHRLSTIALADRVVLVEGGRVVATGRHQDLLATEPRYVEVLADATAGDTNDGEDPAW